MDQLPFPRVLSLCEHWREFPPDHEILRVIAGMLGYKPEPTTTKKPEVDYHPTQAESSFTNLLDERTYDNLPLHVQSWLTERKEKKT